MLVKRQREAKMGGKPQRQASRIECTDYICHIWQRVNTGGENKAAETEREEMAQKSQQSHYLWDHLQLTGCRSIKNTRLWSAQSQRSTNYQPPRHYEDPHECRLQQSPTPHWKKDKNETKWPRLSSPSHRHPRHHFLKEDSSHTTQTTVACKEGDEWRL